MGWHLQQRWAWTYLRPRPEFHEPAAGWRLSRLALWHPDSSSKPTFWLVLVPDSADGRDCHANGFAVPHNHGPGQHTAFGRRGRSNRWHWAGV